VQAAKRGRRTRRAWVVAGLVAVLVAANAFLVWNLVSTHTATANAEAAQTRTEAALATSRRNLTALRKNQSKATSALEARTQERNELNARNKAAQATTNTRTKAITAAFAQITKTHGNMVSLNVCLLKVQAALNTVSVGDATNGSVALAEVKRLCETQ
jgi:hypothetical protein